MFACTAASVASSASSSVSKWEAMRFSTSAKWDARASLNQGRCSSASSRITGSRRAAPPARRRPPWAENLLVDDAGHDTRHLAVGLLPVLAKVLAPLGDLRLRGVFGKSSWLPTTDAEFKKLETEGTGNPEMLFHGHISKTPFAATDNHTEASFHQERSKQKPVLGQRRHIAIPTG